LFDPQGNRKSIAVLLKLAMIPLGHLQIQGRLGWEIQRGMSHTLGDRDSLIKEDIYGEITVVK
jgi:hypothetical protein